jgi:hypothetical protein
MCAVVLGLNHVACFGWLAACLGAGTICFLTATTEQEQKELTEGLETAVVEQVVEKMAQIFAVQPDHSQFVEKQLATLTGSKHTELRTPNSVVTIDVVGERQSRFHTCLRALDRKPCALFALQTNHCSSLVVPSRCLQSGLLTRSSMSPTCRSSPLRSTQRSTGSCRRLRAFSLTRWCVSGCPVLQFIR